MELLWKRWWAKRGGLLQASTLAVKPVAVTNPAITAPVHQPLFAGLNLQVWWPKLLWLSDGVCETEEVAWVYGAVGSSQLTCARATLCQACCLEPVLRQSALLHDLTLHDITALHGKLGQERRLWIAFCTRAGQNPRLRLAHMSDAAYTGNLSKKVNLLLRLTYTH